MSLRIPIQCLILPIALFAGLHTSAQQIDLSLHPTAVPDSFEIRARSTGAAYTSSPLAVFTIRWEANAGGVADNNDIAEDCNAYDIANFGGVIEVLEHRYFPMLLDLKWNIEECPITSTPEPIGGVRIRDLSGCRNVELVQNAFTYLSNFDYYFSVGGVDVTGDITSGPISSDDCPPCDPPSITGSGSSTLSYCGQGELDLWVQATGTTPDFAWYAPGENDPFHYLPSFSIEDGTVGTYTAIVSNHCGSDTVEVEVGYDPSDCVPPAIDSAWYHPAGSVSFHAQLNALTSGTCLTYTWNTSIGNEYVGTTSVQNISSDPIDHFTLIVSNACGADTMWTLADPNDTCITPTITAITYTDTLWYDTSTGSYYDLVLQAVVTGNYLSHSWTLPNGTMIDGSDELHLFNTPSGSYTLITSNPCGTDTISIEVDIDPCVMPEITWIAASYDTPCLPGPVSLDAGLSGPSPKTYHWYDPDGVLIGTSSAGVDLDDPAEGWYVFVGSNTCGSVTDSVEIHFDTDTAGCTPPQILSLTSNAPICEGDTLVLEAEVMVGEGCVIYDWFGGGVIDTQGPITSAPGGTGNNYGLELSNACGTTSMMIFPTIHGHSQQQHHLCGPTGPVDLDSLVSNPELDGAWFHNGEVHSSYYDPATDTIGQYIHYSSLGCLTFTLDLIEWPGVNAGSDTSITVCSTVEPFPLFSLLNGDPDTGGFWTLGLSTFNGIYDPALHNSHMFVYHVMNGSCGDNATVQVTQIQATPWYPDQDGDGFGDPAEMIMDCDQPDGTVADASDDCPLLFGLIGDACDDGLEGTINDAITAECECVGELTTGLDEIGTSATLIWPNPNGGDLFYLSLSDGSDEVELIIHDRTGRTIDKRSIAGSADPIVIEFERPLAAGVYFVSIKSSAAIRVEPLVIGK